MMALLANEKEHNKVEEEQRGETTLSLARPARKRKSVNRFLIDDFPRRFATRKIVVYQGNGTPLKDIPNVAFKLSKRKTDDNLLLLHIILFGKKAKAPMLKKNLGLFSGFLWVEEEEKQRSKVRKKIEQCVKAKLLDFCNILDIPVNRATVKKEDLSAMLLKFLESPHPTSDTLLADKEKTRNSGIGAKSDVEEEDKKSEFSIGEDYPQKDTDDEEEDREDEQEPHLGKVTAVRKVYSKKCGNSKTRVEGQSTKPTSRKRSSCSSSKEGKTHKKEAGVPGEELQTVLAGILKEVDLNTATLADILGQLGAHFNMDLSHRKSEVKALITDIINKMMDEDEEPDTGKDTDNEDDNDTYYA